MEFRKYLESYNFNIEQEELVEESFLNPDKTLVWFEYGGDWDTGYIEIGIK